MSEPAAPALLATAPEADERPPDQLSRAWKWFYAAATGPLIDRGRATAWAAACIAVNILLLVAPRRLYVSDMPHDLLIPLDGMWRLHHGQWPHVDFITPVGSLFYAILGLAGGITGPENPTALAVANALFAVPIAAMIWIVSRDRLPDPLRGALLLGTTLGAMSPRTLDSLASVSFNAMYNRWSWAVAMVAGCALLLPAQRAPSRLRETQEGAVVALSFIMAAWIKVTFLPLLLATALLSAACTPENRRLMWGVLAGLVLTALSALTPLGQAYLADLATVAQAASDGPGLLRGDRLFDGLFINKTALLLMMGVGIAWMRTSRLSEELRASIGVLAIFGAAGAGLVVGSQNHDATVPFLVIPLLMAWSRLRLRGRAPLLVALTALAAAATALLPASQDFGTTALNAWKARTLTSPMYPEGPLSRIMLPPSGETKGYLDPVIKGEISGHIYDNLKGTYWPADYSPILQDAVRLVESHGLEDRRIASLAFSPHFPYLFGSPPPRGLLAWADWQRTFGESWADRACAALEDTEVVLQPSVWNIEGIHRVHERCLAEEFVERAASPLWTLWVRER